MARAIGDSLSARERHFPKRHAVVRKELTVVRPARLGETKGYQYGKGFDVIRVVG